MDIDKCRNNIDDIDKKILELFEKRMTNASEIAEYKKQHKMPVFQSERENEVIEKIKSSCSPDLQDSCEVLFKNIMDISKCKQQQYLYSDCQVMQYEDFAPIKNYTVGCQGTENAYSHIAGKRLFSNSSFKFYPTFEAIFENIEKGIIDFGILPIQNSTVGNVCKTYELMKKYNFYINAEVKVKIEHCLAVKKGTDISFVYDVYSHEQALSQCSEYIQKMKLHPISYSNTALAAEKVAESDVRISAICSKECAQNLNLDIIDENITNASENYTRFICISKNNFISRNADIISVSLALPHTPGALYRLLTKFSVIGLNLLRIESSPIAGKNFDVIFYLDFQGNIHDKNVMEILNALHDELPTFKFLGNYSEVE